MSDPEVITFRPDPSQYAWTFGGAAPVARVKPPVILELFTEDCFAGQVRSEDDLVSQVCEFPYLNPQTGPFYVEGAEPGDTLAVHFISIEPARTRSCPGPRLRPRPSAWRTAVIAQSAICIQNTSTNTMLRARSILSGKFRSRAASQTATPNRNSRLVCSASAPSMSSAW